MWLGFDLFHVTWVLLFAITIYLITREESRHIERLLLIGLALTGGVSVGYEIVRLVSAPNSTDYLAILFMRTFVMVVLAEMAKDKIYPRSLGSAQVSSLEKFLYALPALAGIPCVVLSFMGRI